MGFIACGKRGGPNFLETIRVDLMTKKCPDDLTPCSNFTAPDDTVCVKPYSVRFECPIIDVYIASEAELTDLLKRGYAATKLNYINPIKYLVFSKNATRDSLQVHNPIIGTAINTREPCFGPD